MKAYVLIETTAGKARSIKKTLARLKGEGTSITALDAVTGPYDFIAVIEGPSLDVIGKLVTESLGAIDGVTRTTTCIVVSIG